MRKLFILGLMILAACTARRDEEGDVSVRPITDRVGDWQGTVGPVNNSGVRGSVRAQSAAVTSGITISIAGARAGAQHPWHVHRGSCGNDLGIVGDPGAYPVLNVGADGTATASANIKVGLNEESSYFVNVHRSASELSTIVSCGALND